MKEYQNPDTLMEMHWDYDMSLREIGEHFGLKGGHKTISYWFDKHDLPKRGVGGEYPYANFFTATEGTDSCGYEFWRTRVDGKKVEVRVHRLLAVAEYGFDAVKGMQVHHINGIKWDNRPSNIRLMTAEEHSRLHMKNRLAP